MSSFALSGKKVYIGIDVHKSTYSMTAISDKKVLKKLTVEADPEIFARSIKKWFEGALEIHSAYEAGFSGFVLHRHLVAHGIHNKVVNPASIAVAANDKVKTDLKDSKKIAVELADDRLKGIYVPTIDEEQERALSRTRDQIAAHRGRVARQIKSRLDLYGYREPNEKRSISSRYIKELRLRLAAKHLLALDFLFETWSHHTRQLLEFRKIYRKKSPKQNERQEITGIYKSAPGVGDVSARAFTDELGDMSRFKSPKALSSFLGLTPTEYSSGDTIRRGHISKQGSGRLRKLLVEVAWRAIKIDPSLNSFFERIAQRRGKKRAIIATARHLALRIRACLKARKFYVIQATN